MRNFFLYVPVGAGMVYAAILYNSRGLLTLAGAAMLLPPFFLCMLWSVRRHLEGRISVSLLPGTGDYRIRFCLENKSPFYLPDIRMKILLKNKGSGKVHKIRLAGDVCPGQKAELTGIFQSPEFGLWQAECRKCFCYDCLGLFRLKKEWKETLQFMVFPSCYETNLKVGIRTRLFQSDSSWYHPRIGGDDPAEVLKLREYRRGDRMNQIHWKLSAKNEELIVAETSMPMGCNVVVFLDVDTGEMDRKTGIACWEVLHTLSQEMVNQECFHFLVWYEKETGRLRRRAIREQEDLTEFWNEILQHETGRCLFLQEYEQEFRGEPFASVILWKQELELYVNDRFLIQIIPEQVKRQLLELELMV